MDIGPLYGERHGIDVMDERLLIETMTSPGVNWGVLSLHDEIRNSVSVGKYWSPLKITWKNIGVYRCGIHNIMDFTNGVTNIYCAKSMSGKSTILDVILLGLFGKALGNELSDPSEANGASEANAVNGARSANGASEANAVNTANYIDFDSAVTVGSINPFVTFEIMCDGAKYVIHRSSNDALTLHKDDVDITSETYADTQRAIEEIVGTWTRFIDSNVISSRHATVTSKGQRYLSKHVGDICGASMYKRFVDECKLMGGSWSTERFRTLAKIQCIDGDIEWLKKGLMSYGQESYGQESYGQESYGQESYGQESYGQDGVPRYSEKQLSDLLAKANCELRRLESNILTLGLRVHSFQSGRKAGPKGPQEPYDTDADGNVIPIADTKASLTLLVSKLKSEGPKGPEGPEEKERERLRDIVGTHDYVTDSIDLRKAKRERDRTRMEISAIETGLKWYERDAENAEVKANGARRRSRLAREGSLALVRELGGKRVALGDTLKAMDTGVEARRSRHSDYYTEFETYKEYERLFSPDMVPAAMLKARMKSFTDSVNGGPTNPVTVTYGFTLKDLGRDGFAPILSVRRRGISSYQKLMLDISTYSAASKVSCVGGARLLIIDGPIDSIHPSEFTRTDILSRALKVAKEEFGSVIVMSNTEMPKGVVDSVIPITSKDDYSAICEPESPKDPKDPRDPKDLGGPKDPKAPRGAVVTKADTLAPTTPSAS